MEDLYEATHENVQLAVLDGHDALFVDKISGRHSVQTVTRVGGRLPLHATGVGKVLLAYATPDFIEEVIERGLPRLAPRTIVDPDELRAELARVRASGFAQTREEMTRGSVSVAAPVFGPTGGVVAAISLVVAAHPVNVDRLSLAVRTAALGLSRAVSQTWDGMPVSTSALGHPRESAANLGVPPGGTGRARSAPARSSTRVGVKSQ
jgi:DNA-binding IclR family transcriptional regulator